MTEDEVVELMSTLPGVAVVTATQESGAPEIAWGDTFVFYDPTGTDAAAQRFPFATIVTKDYTGFDMASNLDRPGVFRVNVAVGSRRFAELFGYPPGAHGDHETEHDYAALDRLVPHPVYASQGWVSIVNPGEDTGPRLRDLLEGAHALAKGRHDRRHP